MTVWWHDVIATDSPRWDLRTVACPHTSFDSMQQTINPRFSF
jgi:hypothetical protein